MLVLPGSSALSAARFQLLAADISALDLGLSLREVVHAYAVDVAPSAAIDSDRLAALLHPGTATAADPRHRSAGARIVAPRLARFHLGQ